MGASTRLAVYSEGNPKDILRALPTLDREASRLLAERLFPNEVLTYHADGNLVNARPYSGDIYVGCFSGLTVVSAAEYPEDFPSRLAPGLIDAVAGGVLHLHAMSGTSGCFSYAIWHEGKLVRALSLAPETGVVEDFGARLVFELPYWEGCRAEPFELSKDAPLPFHPTDLGEAALQEFFGFQLEGE